MEKRSAEENNNLLAGEMTSLGDKVVALDGSMEHLSQRIEVLVEEKKAFEDRVDRANKKLGMRWRRGTARRMIWGGCFRKELLEWWTRWLNVPSLGWE